MLKEQDLPKLEANQPFRPILSVGIRKARTIIKHFNEIKDFVDNYKSQPKQPEETDEDRKTTKSRKQT